MKQGNKKNRGIKSFGQSEKEMISWSRPSSPGRRMTIAQDASREKERERESAKRGWTGEGREGR